MEFNDGSIIYSLPDDTLLSEKEGNWTINLLETYKEFIKNIMELL